jgi:transcriptional regulator with GAF, ATPase, and Fis domain
VRYGASIDGRVYLERRRPMGVEHSPLVLDTVANLLALPIQRTAETALRVVQERPDLAGLRFRGVVGHNPAMLGVLAQVCHLAGTDVPVLICGESGTGKELVARALHESGPRLSVPFVAVNCSAVPEGLLEAEFFGVERGAATGVAARAGRFEVAGPGTVFLDEVGDMSPALQAKLLRVLEDKTVVRVGGTRPLKVEARVVCATNQDLKEKMRQGAFRSDLYYRLAGTELSLPPLRKRPEDIEELVGHIIALVNQEYKRQVRGASPEALQRLRCYRWPGNVRELQHVLERAVILAESDVLQVSDLPQAVAAFDVSAPPVLRVARRLAQRDARTEGERAALVDCLKRAGGNVTKAAELAGYSRVQFYRLMRRYGISRGQV